MLAPPVNAFTAAALMSGPLTHGARIQLQAAHGPSEGQSLQSNMGQGGPAALGRTDRRDLGWRVLLKAKGEDSMPDANALVESGATVMLQGEGNHAFMYSNGRDQGGFSGGGWNPGLGWIITSNSGAGVISLGSEVMLQSLHHGKCLLSATSDRGNFTYGTADHTTLSWRVVDDEWLVAKEEPPTVAIELSTLPLEGRWEHLQSLTTSEERQAAWATMEPEERAATLAIQTAEYRTEGLNSMRPEDRDTTSPCPSLNT